MPQPREEEDTPLIERLRGYCKEAPGDSLAADALTVLLAQRKQIAALLEDVAALRAEIFNQVARISYLANDDRCTAFIYGKVETFDHTDAALAWLREQFNAAWPEKKI